MSMRRGDARAASGSPARTSAGGSAGPLGLLDGDLRTWHERGIDPLEDDAAVDDATTDVAAARQVVHDVQQHLFEDRPQPACPGAAQQRLVGDGLERVVAELQVDAVVLEEL